MSTHWMLISVAVTWIICGLCHICRTMEVGDLRLADGPSPNIGRVEMYLGDRGWFNTCDPLWDINDAIVVCRQLGFPGAAFAKARSTYGRARGIPLSRTVKCTGYESTLSNCPYHTTRLCTSAVSVVCQEPGYVGCYADEPSDSMFTDGHAISHVMDITECKAFCKTKSALFVGLKNSQECYCGRSGNLISRHEKLKDSECQMPCAGNSNEICGGVSSKGQYVVSVHELTVGHCDPLSSPENGYLLDTDFSYGEVVRFECDSGYNLVGPPALRCVQMEVNVAWNASVPLCTDIPSSAVTGGKAWLPTRGSSGHLLADKPGLILCVALIVILALLAPACVAAVLRRHYSKRKQVVHVNAEKNPYQDLVYNPSYELSSSPYEPLRPPRKRDALRQQQQQQQKRISTLEPYTQMSFGVDVDTSLTTTTTSTTKHIYAHTLNS